MKITKIYAETNIEFVCFAQFVASSIASNPLIFEKKGFELSLNKRIKVNYLKE